MQGSVEMLLAMKGGIRKEENYIHLFDILHSFKKMDMPFSFILLSLFFLMFLLLSFYLVFLFSFY